MEANINLNTIVGKDGLKLYASMFVISMLFLAGCNSSSQVEIAFVSTLQGYLEECG